jgi:hypothetical protein
MQMYEDASGVRMLTFLNPYKHAIYFYDYEKNLYVDNISYEKEGSDAILGPSGYYIQNMDSIYVFNKPLLEVMLTDSSGHVKSRIPLWSDDFYWQITHPVYNFSTVNPLFFQKEKIILTGLSPFSIADSLVQKRHFTACIDMKTNQTEFRHTYPEELFGSNANWDDPVFMQVYPTLSSSGDIIHSFTMSHDLYVNDWETGKNKIVYAGSNVVRCIHSIDYRPQKTPREVIGAHYFQQDLYAAILHDPWRKVYYRFLLQGIPDATFSTPIGKKPVIVILMDEQFNYLGETLIGTGEEWNWTNSFVTKEGLNIEYIGDIAKDLDEAYLDLKIFTIEKI